MEFATFFNAAVGIIAVISAGISTLLLGSLKTLRDSNTDLRSRIGDLEDKNRLLTAEIVLAKADRDAAWRNVRGDDRFEAMISKIDLHNSAAESHWQAEEALLRQVIANTGGAA